MFTEDFPSWELGNLSTVTPLENLGNLSTVPTLGEHMVADTPYDELGAYKAAVLLPKVVLPVLMVVGVVGNILTLVTLHSRAYGPSPSTLGFSLLAVADTGYLIGNLRWWAKAMFKVDFRMVSPASCRFHQFWTYFFRHLSSCTLAFITVERVVCVCFPIQWKTTFTSRKNTVFVGFLIFVLLGINLQIPLNYGFNWDSYNNSTYCNVYKSKDDWYNRIWIPLDEVLHCFLPATIIISGNIVIIWRMRTSPNLSGDNEERNTSITVMLVAVSGVFLLTTLPNAIFHLGDANRIWPDYTDQEYADVILALNVTVLWARVNNAINFMLYCVTGSKFRHAFLKTFRLRRNRCKPRSKRRSSRFSSSTVTRMSRSQVTITTQL